MGHLVSTIVLGVVLFHAFTVLEHGKYSPVPEEQLLPYLQIPANITSGLVTANGTKEQQQFHELTEDPSMQTSSSCNSTLHQDLCTSLFAHAETLLMVMNIKFHVYCSCTSRVIAQLAELTLDVDYSVGKLSVN